MKNKPITWFLLLLISAFCISSCQKEYNPGFSIKPGTHPGDKVVTTISGRVTDEFNEPVKSAEVIAGNSSARTDHDGYFNLQNTTVPADTAFIMVHQQDYFLGSRTISAIQDGTEYVQIELIKVRKSGEVASSAGGAVAFASGGSAIFPENAVVRAADGSSYSGKIIVNQSFIDPTSKGFTKRMPGDLKGITLNNELRGLQSFGMMAIQLNGEGGELLQVAPDKLVELHFPIPSELSGFAPQTIPLWYFDEIKGLWKEEGSAVKTGNEYIGQVSHFSFWNVDNPFLITEISFTLKDQAGHPRANVLVEIRKKSDNTIASGFSDGSGLVKGWIPSGEPLEMRIYTACNSLIEKRDIGPFSTPAELGDIIVDAGPTDAYWYSLNNAEIINCHDQYIANGYYNLYFRGMNLRYPLEGQPSFSVGFMHCSPLPDSAILTIYDADRDKYLVKSFWIEPGGATTVGKLLVCDGELGQFMRVDIDGKTHEFLSPVDSLFAGDYGTGRLLFASRAADNSNSLSISFPSSPAPYTTTTFLFSLKGNSFHYTSNSGNLMINKYGAVNEFVEGYIVGDVIDSISGRKNIPVNGKFRIKRKQ